MAHEETLLSWLNDAYAMENSIIGVLENHIKDAKDMPQLQSKLEEHLGQTRQHAEMVKTGIERHGGNTSSLKTSLASITGMVQGMSTGAAGDELIKNDISDYATEHFEIASYRSLIAAAQDLGDAETIRFCQQILRDEQAMAQFLEQQLPMLVTDYIQFQMAEHQPGKTEAHGYQAT